ncbi:MAG: hypothetical protein JWM02_3256 [Frankiales bacterium]|nr:hypothetical protein [Frankiales bacterium]
MIKKFTLLAGLGLGYVLGAKAGQERYQQIKRLADDLMGRPEVQQATRAFQHTASDLVGKAREAVHEEVDKVTSKTVDLTDKTPAQEPSTMRVTP